VEERPRLVTSSDVFELSLRCPPNFKTKVRERPFREASGSAIFRAASAGTLGDLKVLGACFLFQLIAFKAGFKHKSPGLRVLANYEPGSTTRNRGRQILRYPQNFGQVQWTCSPRLIERAGKSLNAVKKGANSPEEAQNHAGPVSISSEQSAV